METLGGAGWRTWAIHGCVPKKLARYGGLFSGHRRTFRTRAGELRAAVRVKMTRHDASIAALRGLLALALLAAFWPGGTAAHSCDAPYETPLLVDGDIDIGGEYVE